MIQINRFPGGKTRAATFSYDDGHPNDERLIALFNKYGVKGTFHLNGIYYVNNTPEQDEALRRRYEGHEISCHGLRHGRFSSMTPSCVLNEILEDRRVLERIARYPVVGLSYPSGAHDTPSRAALSAAGILYSRTVDSTKYFGPPDDFMRWNPSCHHRDALPLCERFARDVDSEWCERLLYIWGHSHEFRTEEDWAYMETLVKTIAHNDQIWYATNVEIYEYLQAQRQLQVSVDESMIYNPSRLPVWVERNKTDVFCIEPGQVLHLD